MTDSAPFIKNQVSNKDVIRDIVGDLERLYFRVKYLKHGEELDLKVIEEMIERLKAAVGARYL